MDVSYVNNIENKIPTRQAEASVRCIRDTNGIKQNISQFDSK